MYGQFSYGSLTIHTPITPADHGLLASIYALHISVKNKIGEGENNENLQIYFPGTHFNVRFYN